MKKVILAVAVIAMVAGFASCKKTSKCVCTYEYAGVTVTTDAAEYNVKSCDKIESLDGIDSSIKFTCEAAK